MQRFALTIKYGIQSRLIERSDRIIERKPIPFTKCIDLCKEQIVLKLTQRFDSTFADRLALVGDDPFHIENSLFTQSVAVWTSPLR